MSELRVAHVIHPNSAVPTIAREGDRILIYGQGTSGIIDHLVVHDAPRHEMDDEWLTASAFTRIARGGTVYWMLRDE